MVGSPGPGRRSRLGPRSAALVVVGLAVGLARCAPSGGLPLHKATDNGPAGIQSGALIESGSCVYIREPSLGHRWLVIWPPGYSKVGESIRDGDGNVIASIGAEITLGGGEIKGDEFDFLQGQLVTDVPEACRDSDYWVTNGPASAG